MIDDGKAVTISRNSLLFGRWLRRSPPWKTPTFSRLIGRNSLLFGRWLRRRLPADSCQGSFYRRNSLLFGRWLRSYKFITEDGTIYSKS